MKNSDRYMPGDKFRRDYNTDIIEVINKCSSFDETKYTCVIKNIKGVVIMRCDFTEDFLDTQERVKCWTRPRRMNNEY